MEKYRRTLQWGALLAGGGLGVLTSLGVEQLPFLQNQSLLDVGITLAFGLGGAILGQKVGEASASYLQSDMQASSNLMRSLRQESLSPFARRVLSKK